MSQQKMATRHDTLRNLTPRRETLEVFPHTIVMRRCPSTDRRNTTGRTERKIVVELEGNATAAAESELCVIYRYENCSSEESEK
jgi:hypothetical protein